MSLSSDSDENNFESGESGEERARSGMLGIPGRGCKGAGRGEMPVYTRGCRLTCVRTRLRAFVILNLDP